MIKRGESASMMREIDWLSVLVECKNSVRERVAELLRARDRLNVSLGVGAGGDVIRHVDLAAENAIIDVLKRNGISFTLISEESGVKEYGEAPRGCYVTVDPIDGTTNAVRGVPFYATSIAVSAKPTLSAVNVALVADLFHNVTYTALKGKGAYRDGQAIAPSKVTLLEEAVMGINLNMRGIAEEAPRLTKLIQRTKHVRHLGANALELCYVADGTMDAFADISGKLRVTDVAAAWFIVKEAGAVMTTLNGKPLRVSLDPKQRVAFVAAANETIHRTILGLIRSGN